MEMEEGQGVATLADDGIAYLVLHGEFSDDRQELEVLWEGKTTSLMAVVEKVSAHLGGDAQLRLSLDADAMVAIGVLIDIIHRTVGVDTIIEGLGFNLPDIVMTLIDTLDPDDPDQLVGLLDFVLPMIGIKAGSVELDLATFFDSPFNLRDLLPFMGPEPGTIYDTFILSFECARGGAQTEDTETATVATLFIHDPSSTAEQVTLDMAAFENLEESNDSVDTETVTLDPVPGFTGLYSGTVELVTTAGVPGDGQLYLPPGAGVVGHYNPEATPEEVVTITGTLEDGLTKWDYGAACSKSVTPWDGSHFGQMEFATAVEISAPGQMTPLEPIPADGKQSRVGAMAFPSPSFAGLIWLKGDDGFAVANQASFNGLIGGVLGALEGF